MEYARHDFNELRKQIKEEGFELPSNLVPMERVVDYYHINITYLKKISKINAI